MYCIFNNYVYFVMHKASLPFIALYMITFGYNRKVVFVKDKSKEQRVLDHVIYGTLQKSLLRFVSISQRFASSSWMLICILLYDISLTLCTNWLHDDLHISYISKLLYISSWTASWVSSLNYSWSCCWNLFISVFYYTQ